MLLKKAQQDNIREIKDFYSYVAEHTEHMDKYGRWIYGMHPTDEMIEGYITSGYMYFAEEDGEIIAAVAVTYFQDDSYHPINWQVEAKDDEVAVIHLLGINPKNQGCGLAKKIVNEIIEMAKMKCMKSVRLDALCCNLPAHRLYESQGFIKCGTQNWYASNTGDIDFYLYEYTLTNGD